MNVDARYDPQARMPWSVAQTKGYHTMVPAGTRVHATMEAADYALSLLEDSKQERIARAHDVLGALVSLQITDPTSKHYGLWGYFAEEPPDHMSPADWNWADFIGVRLAQVLAAHGKRLHADTRDALGEALRHAAMAVFRRNVGPEYTNIAVMGAVAAAAAGEILGDALLLDYARRRLAAVVALRRRVGGFTEYNSPSYHKIVLEELDRATLIVADHRFCDLAAQLRDLTWDSLAERFHPGTGQLAGPISRAYADKLTPELSEFFARLRSRPLTARREVRTRFSEAVSGTTWMVEDACLGSASQEIAWNQRRPLLGYWRTPQDPAVVLRARMLLNGHDLSAAWCRQVQQANRVLSAWSLNYDSGDFHPELDQPAGSVFRITDLRLIVSLTGAGVVAAQLEDGLPTLVGGQWQAIVHTAPATFWGHQVQWEASNHDGEARVEAVLHVGPPQDVDFHHAALRAAFAVELVPTTQTPVANALHDDGLHWRWRDLSVAIPAEPTPFVRS